MNVREIYEQAGPLQQSSLINGGKIRALPYESASS